MGACAGGCMEPRRENRISRQPSLRLASQRGIEGAAGTRVSTSPQSSKPLSQEATEVLDVAAACLPDGTLSEFQRNWCTEDHVKIYLRARKSDVNAAGEILAFALDWRERYQDILTKTREPEWVTDLRVLDRGKDGHPILYTCALYQDRSPCPVKLAEHMAAVFEAAVKAMRKDAKQFVFILDLHGFQLLNNLDPRPALAMMEMAKHPYRNRLARGLIVDAPVAFSAIWSIASPIMPASTQSKVSFVSMDDAIDQVTLIGGDATAQTVTNVMRRNRAGHNLKAKFPSEILDEDAPVLTPSSGRLAGLRRSLSSRFSLSGSPTSPGAQNGKIHSEPQHQDLACILVLMVLLAIVAYIGIYGLPRIPRMPKQINFRSGLRIRFNNGRVSLTW